MAIPTVHSRNKIDGQTIRLAFDPASDAVHIIEAPPQARVVHTFWFAWAAYHEQTELYGE
jgi:hypothetical protein